MKYIIKYRNRLDEDTDDLREHMVSIPGNVNKIDFALDIANFMVGARTVRFVESIEKMEEFK